MHCHLVTSPFPVHFIAKHRAEIDAGKQYELGKEIPAEIIPETMDITVNRKLWDRQ
jgi:hypothetical protein